MDCCRVTNTKSFICIVFTFQIGGGFVMLIMSEFEFRNFLYYARAAVGAFCNRKLIFCKSQTEGWSCSRFMVNLNARLRVGEVNGIESFIMNYICSLAHRFWNFASIVKTFRCAFKNVWKTFPIPAFLMAPLKMNRMQKLSRDFLWSAMKSTGAGNVKNSRLSMSQLIIITSEICCKLFCTRGNRVDGNQTFWVFSSRVDFSKSR